MASEARPFVEPFKHTPINLHTESIRLVEIFPRGNSSISGNVKRFELVVKATPLQFSNCLLLLFAR